MESSEFILNLTYRSHTYTIRTSLDVAAAELGAAIQAETGAAFETLKILVPGLKAIVPSQRQADTVRALGGCSVTNRST